MVWFSTLYRNSVPCPQPGSSPAMYLSGPASPWLDPQSWAPAGARPRWQCSSWRGLVRFPNSLEGRGTWPNGSRPSILGPDQGDHYNVYHDGENLAYHIRQAVLFANLTNRALLPLPCNSSVPPNKGHMLCPADTTRWFSRGTKCSRWVSWVQGGQNCSFWCRPQTLPGIRWPCLQRWRCPAGRWLAMIMTHPHSGCLILLIVCLFNVIVFTRAALASDEGKMIFESNTDGHSVEVTGRHCTVWLWWWY